MRKSVSDVGLVMKTPILADEKIDLLEMSISTRIQAAFRVAVTRLMWLSGLLMLQSISSFILEANRELIEEHIVLTLFLTMLVGAGGNSGAQAAVAVIRGIALKRVSRRNMHIVLLNELIVGVLLSSSLFFMGFGRVIITRGDFFLDPVAVREALTIGIALWLVVIFAVTIGAGLPLLFHFYLEIDSAHSGSSVQVIMDVLGVWILMQIAAFNLK